MCALFLPSFLALYFAAVQANLFDEDLLASLSEKYRSSDSKFQPQLLKRESAFKVPNNDSDFLSTNASTLIPGSDVRCIQSCVDIVKKDNENSTMACKTLSQLQECLMACPDKKFPKFLLYHLAKFESRHCQGSGKEDGFAEFVDKVKQCEKRLHNPEGEYMLKKEWERCEDAFRPKSLGEYCLVLQKCFFDTIFMALKRYCSADISDFYQFEIKSTVAIRQNLFGSNRVTPNRCSMMYDIPNNEKC